MILIYLFQKCVSKTHKLVYTVITSTGSTNDSLILNNQLDVLHTQQPKLFNESKIILADAAYDSSILRNKVKDLKLEKLLTPFTLLLKKE